MSIQVGLSVDDYDIISFKFELLSNTFVAKYKDITKDIIQELRCINIAFSYTVDTNFGP